MAIDPIYIRVPDVPEFAALGGEESLDGGRSASSSTTVRRASKIDYAGVRRLKHAALRAAFERFRDVGVAPRHRRARAMLKAFISEQAWWVEDYALFRAIHASHGERPWTEWPAALQRREPADIDRARRELMPEVLFYQYMQWQATTQWRAARGQTHGVALFGDLPFMVDGDSADVWARQYQFRLDASIGAPPDAFSADGPELGHAALPVGRHRRRAFPLAARARAAQRGSLRRIPRRPSGRLLPDIRVAEGRRRAVFHAGRRADRRSRSANGCSASSARSAR